MKKWLFLWVMLLGMVPAMAQSVVYDQTSSNGVRTLICEGVNLGAVGDVDVNVFARRYFEGGGHRNAAGGKSYVSMPETIAHFEKAIAEYFGEVSPVVPVRSFEAEEQAIAHEGRIESEKPEA